MPGKELNNVTVQSVLEKVASYVAKGHITGGSLHMVLSNYNIDDASLEFCKDYAEKANDSMGIELAEDMLKLSKTQRKKVCKSW